MGGGVVFVGVGGPGVGAEVEVVVRTVVGLGVGQATATMPDVGSWTFTAESGFADTKINGRLLGNSKVTLTGSRTSVVR